MPVRALTANDVATELGRTTGWLYEHWRELVAKKHMPKPLHEGQSLAWSAAQFYAWLDRDLTKPQRVAAMAFRAAFEAASTSDARLIDTSVADAQAALEARYVNGREEALR